MAASRVTTCRRCRTSCPVWRRLPLPAEADGKNHKQSGGHRISHFARSVTSSTKRDYQQPSGEIKRYVWLNRCKGSTINCKSFTLTSGSSATTLAASTVEIAVPQALCVRRLDAAFIFVLGVIPKRQLRGRTPQRAWPAWRARTS